MADVQIKDQALRAVPEGTDQIAVDDAAGATWRVVLSTLYQVLGIGYVLHALCAPSSPADGTTYYLGSTWGLVLVTTAGLQRIYIPRSGTVTRVDITTVNVTNNGSSETSSIYLRLNSATDTLLTSSFRSDNQYFNITGLSVAVTAGDFIEIKWVSPTWATNPVGLIISAQIYVA